jgi:hypothetical protein
VIIKRRAAVAGLGVLLVMVLACSGKTGGSMPEIIPDGGLVGSNSSGASDTTGSTRGSGSGGGSASSGFASPSGPSAFACGTDSGSALADEAGLPPDAGGGSEQLGGDCCATALHVSVGGTVQGSTCGGPISPGGDSPCIGGRPYAFIYVDAPAGTQLVVSASTGVSIEAFVGCTPQPGKWDTCTYGLDTNAVALTPNLAARLFVVEHADVDCGDFTFHAVAGPATEAGAGTGATSDAGEPCPSDVRPGEPCLSSSWLVCPFAGTLGCQCITGNGPGGAATWQCKQ